MKPSSPICFDMRISIRLVVATAFLASPGTADPRLSLRVRDDTAPVAVRGFEQCVFRLKLPPGEPHVFDAGPMPVVYGRPVMLQHYASGMIVAVSKEPSDSFPGCSVVHLVPRDAAGAACLFRLQPRYKVRADQDVVFSHDAVHLVHQSSRLNLHVSTVQHGGVIDAVLSEVNAHDETTTFELGLYDDKLGASENASDAPLRAGRACAIFHREKESFLTVESPRHQLANRANSSLDDGLATTSTPTAASSAAAFNGGASLQQPQDILSVTSVLGSAQIVPHFENLFKSISDNNGNNNNQGKPPMADGDTNTNNDGPSMSAVGGTSIDIANPASAAALAALDAPNSFWLMERADPTVGGSLRVGVKLRMRHIVTNRYLLARTNPFTRKLEMSLEHLASAEDGEQSVFAMEHVLSSCPQEGLSPDLVLLGRSLIVFRHVDTGMYVSCSNDSACSIALTPAPSLEDAVTVMNIPREYQRGVQFLLGNCEFLRDYNQMCYKSQREAMSVDAFFFSPVVRRSMEHARRALTSLIRHCSASADEDVLTREGLPLPAHQAAMFEVGLHLLVFEVLVSPFVSCEADNKLELPLRGGLLQLSDLGKHHEVYMVCRLCYRLLKQMSKQCKLSSVLVDYVDFMLSQEGYKLHVADTLGEIFTDNPDLPPAKCRQIIHHFVNMLMTSRSSGYLNFLTQLCVVEGRGSRHNQRAVVELLGPHIKSIFLKQYDTSELFQRRRGAVGGDDAASPTNIETSASFLASGRHSCELVIEVPQEKPKKDKSGGGSSSSSGGDSKKGKKDKEKSATTADAASTATATPPTAKPTLMYLSDFVVSQAGSKLERFFRAGIELMGALSVGNDPSALQLVRAHLPVDRLFYMLSSRFPHAAALRQACLSVVRHAYFSEWLHFSGMFPEQLVVASPSAGSCWAHCGWLFLSESKEDTAAWNLSQKASAHNHHHHMSASPTTSTSSSSSAATASASSSSSSSSSSGDLGERGVEMKRRCAEVLNTVLHYYSEAASHDFDFCIELARLLRVFAQSAKETGQHNSNITLSSISTIVSATISILRIRSGVEGRHVKTEKTFPAMKMLLEVLATLRVFVEYALITTSQIIATETETAARTAKSASSNGGGGGGGGGRVQSSSAATANTGACIEHLEQEVFRNETLMPLLVEVTLYDSSELVSVALEVVDLLCSARSFCSAQLERFRIVPGEYGNAFRLLRIASQRILASQSPCSTGLLPDSQQVLCDLVGVLTDIDRDALLNDTHSARSNQLRAALLHAWYRPPVNSSGGSNTKHCMLRPLLKQWMMDTADGNAVQAELELRGGAESAAAAAFEATGIHNCSTYNSIFALMLTLSSVVSSLVRCFVSHAAGKDLRAALLRFFSVASVHPFIARELREPAVFAEIQRLLPLHTVEACRTIFNVVSHFPHTAGTISKATFTTIFETTLGTRSVPMARGLELLLLSDFPIERNQKLFLLLAEKHQIGALIQSVITSTTRPAAFLAAPSPSGGSSPAISPAHSSAGPSALMTPASPSRNLLHIVTARAAVALAADNSASLITDASGGFGRMLSAARISPTEYEQPQQMAPHSKPRLDTSVFTTSDAPPTPTLSTLSPPGANDGNHEDDENRAPPMRHSSLSRLRVNYNRRSSDEELFLFTECLVNLVACSSVNEQSRAHVATRLIPVAAALRVLSNVRSSKPNLVLGMCKFMQSVVFGGDITKPSNSDTAATSNAKKDAVALSSRVGVGRGGIVSAALKESGAEAGSSSDVPLHATVREWNTHGEWFAVLDAMLRYVDEWSAQVPSMERDQFLSVVQGIIPLFVTYFTRVYYYPLSSEHKGGPNPRSYLRVVSKFLDAYTQHVGRATGSSLSVLSLFPIEMLRTFGIQLVASRQQLADQVKTVAGKLTAASLLRSERAAEQKRRRGGGIRKGSSSVNNNNNNNNKNNSFRLDGVEMLTAEESSGSFFRLPPAADFGSTAKGSAAAGASSSAADTGASASSSNNLVGGLRSAQSTVAYFNSLGKRAAATPAETTPTSNGSDRGSNKSSAPRGGDADGDDADMHDLLSYAFSSRPLPALRGIIDEWSGAKGKRLARVVRLLLAMRKSPVLDSTAAAADSNKQPANLDDWVLLDGNDSFSSNGGKEEKKTAAAAQAAASPAREEDGIAEAEGEGDDVLPAMDTFETRYPLLHRILRKLVTHMLLNDLPPSGAISALEVFCALCDVAQEATPSEEAFAVFQTYLEGLGALRMVTEVLRTAGSDEMRIKTLRFGIAALQGGNVTVQDRLLHFFNTADEVFFRECKRHFGNAIANLLHRSVRLNYRNFYASAALTVGPSAVANYLALVDSSQRDSVSSGSGTFSPKKVGDATHDDSNDGLVDGGSIVGGGASGADAESSSDEFQITLSRVLQLFCEGHHHGMQLYLASQGDNFHSVNVVALVLTFFDELVRNFDPECARDIEFEKMEQLIALLIEVCQGPCVVNQQILIVNGVCRVLHRLLSLDPFREEYRARAAELLSIQKQCVILIQALLEGQQDARVPLRVLHDVPVSVYDALLARLAKRAEEHEESKLKLREMGPLLGSSRSAASRERNAVRQLHLQLEEEFKKIGPRLQDLTYGAVIALHTTVQLIPSGTAAAAAAQCADAEALLGKYSKSVGRLGMIEIERNDNIEKIFFRVPDVCAMLSEDVKHELIWNIDRSSQGSKLYDLLDRSDAIIYELEVMRGLREFWAKRNRTIDFFMNTLSLRVYDNITIVNAVLINITFLVVADSTRLLDQEIDWLGWEGILRALAYLQLLVTSMAFLMDALVNVPLSVYRWKKRLEAEEKKALKRGSSALTTAVGQDAADAKEQSTAASPTSSGKKTQAAAAAVETSKRDELMPRLQRAASFASQWFSAAFSRFDTSTRAAAVVISLLGLYYNDFFFSIHLLGFISKSAILRDVIKAVTQNGTSLLLTAALGAILIYLFSIVGFVMFSDHFDGDCKTLSSCVVHIMSTGLRQGGGVGDLMQKVNQGAPLYAWRMLYDILFWAFIIVIFLNILFGLIVDAFADLRDQKKSKEDDIATYCLICGLDSFLLDRYGEGFDFHTNTEHLVWNYLYFLQHLRLKPRDDYSGQESYVHQCVSKGDISFFPSQKCTSLKKYLEREKEKERNGGNNTNSSSGGGGQHSNNNNAGGGADDGDGKPTTGAKGQQGNQARSPTANNLVPSGSLAAAGGDMSGAESDALHNQFASGYFGGGGFLDEMAAVAAASGGAAAVDPEQIANAVMSRMQDFFANGGGGVGGHHEHQHGAGFKVPLFSAAESTRAIKKLQDEISELHHQLADSERKKLDAMKKLNRTNEISRDKDYLAACLVEWTSHVSQGLLNCTSRKMELLQQSMALQRAAAASAVEREASVHLRQLLATASAGNNNNNNNSNNSGGAVSAATKAIGILASRFVSWSEHAMTLMMDVTMRKMNEATLSLGRIAGSAAAAASPSSSLSSVMARHTSLAAPAPSVSSSSSIPSSSRSGSNAATVNPFWQQKSRDDLTAASDAYLRELAEIVRKAK